MSQVMTKRIGRFDLVEQIGEGAFGRYFRGYDPATGRDVTVQMITIEPNVTQEAREQALRQARSAAALSHPNVAAVFDIGVDNDVAFVVREFVDGKTLQQYLADGMRLTESETVEVLDQIAAAVDFAASRGVVHGSLEPVHVLVPDGGPIKVAGFGIGKIAVLASHDTLTFTGHPEYMAPEKIRGDALDTRADVYSLGAIAYELVAGARPFATDSVITTIFKAANEPPPAIPNLTVETTALNDAIHRALAKTPVDRFSTCREFVEAFRAAVPEPPEVVDVGDAPPGMVSSMFCDQCGATLRPGVRFCFKCGAATAAAAADAETEPLVADLPDVALPPAVEYTVPEPEVTVAEVPVVHEPPPLPTERAPIPVVLPTEHVAATPVARAGSSLPPPLAGYASSTGINELPPPGADLGGKPKSGIFSGIIPVIVVLILVLLAFMAFGFVVAPKLIKPVQGPPAPQQETSKLATTGNIGSLT